MCFKKPSSSPNAKATATSTASTTDPPTPAPEPSPAPRPRQLDENAGFLAYEAALGPKDGGRRDWHLIKPTETAGQGQSGKRWKDANKGDISHLSFQGAFQATMRALEHAGGG